MNYFNYFSEIEEAFIRRRGKHVFLSPLDWALIESWKERGVPLHVALRGIEKAFDSYQSKPRKRSIKTLFYCQEEVEAQFNEWLVSQIGANGEEKATETDVGPGPDDGSSLPFPREMIIAYLQKACDELDQLNKKRAKLNGFAETLERVTARLNELKEDFAKTTKPNAELLEESLTSLEKMLDEALFASLSKEDMNRAQSECEAQLKDYRARMDQNVYEQTLSSLLRKRLREQYGLPRLSLFYL